MNPMDLSIIAASITAITTVGECDAIIATVEKEKENAQFLALTEERKIERLSTLSATIDSDFASATAEKASYVTVIPTLPAGNPVRKQLEDKVVALDFRLFTLNQRRARIGRGAFISARMKYSLLLQEVDNSTPILALLTQKRATL
ncbi:MAG: hypothetical protein EAZ85_14405 [Bacteroidetes bacterium]|nr:MAG: hypothetical protein EAZ85_14405 [Bacteroidota bacterium]